MARLEGFEPPTYGLEVRCSIQLSYKRSIMVDPHVQTNPCQGHTLPKNRQYFNE